MTRLCTALVSLSSLTYFSAVVAIIATYVAVYYIGRRQAFEEVARRLAHPKRFTCPE